MADFAAHNSTEDWSLQAIVRGSSGDFTKIVMDGRDSFSGTNDHLHLHNLDDRDFLASFPDLFFDACNNGSSDELEDLYKPFYNPVSKNYASDIHHQCNNTVVAQLQQKSTDDDINNNNNNVVEEHDDQKSAHEVASDQSSSVSENCVVAAGYDNRDGSYTPKYKRSRKNQHKRVVIQVPAEGLSSDMWAWRKYGQKPIKGSPYPRSYYRCSSSKGCLARKQVEESYTEPGMFIITYTAEHSHSKPTRRNSLAGTIRQKFPSNKSNSNKREKLIQGSSRNSSSPKAVINNNTQVTSNRDAVFSYHQARIIKREAQGDCHNDTGFNHNMENNGDDLMFVNEDFFSGLEDFDDFISGSVCRTLAQQTLPVRS